MDSSRSMNSLLRDLKRENRGNWLKKVDRYRVGVIVIVVKIVMEI